MAGLLRTAGQLRLGLLMLLASGLALEAQESGVNPTSYLSSQGAPPTKSVAEIWANHKWLPNHADIMAAAGDVYAGLPAQLEPRYKNPCWKEGLDIKCLPYFQILGVSKCGTTDLYHRLEYHPEMVGCGYKGPHFWDEAYQQMHTNRSKNHGHVSVRYDRTFQGYLRIFAKAALRFTTQPAAVTGEASSNTFTGVYAYLRGRTHAKKVTNANLADLLFEATPYGRFIVMFRDPVSRYYSAHYYYRQSKEAQSTPQNFHDRAVREVTSWEECVASDGLAACLKAYEPQQLVKGLYAEFIAPWLAVFPRDQFLFLRNEDYSAAPAEHMRTVVSFLGLSPLQQTAPDATNRMLTVKPHNSQAGRYMPMLNETRKLLQDFYRPYNQKLSAFFGGDPRWLWGY